MSTNSMPDELLLRIVSSDLPRSDLANLCLVSQQFCRVSTPLLYHDIRFAKKSSELQKPCPGLRDVAMLLLSDPKVAGYVKRFSILPPCSTDEPSAASHQEYLSDQAKVVLERKIDALECSNEPAADWKNDITKPFREDALIALLLTALPNLVELHLINFTTGTDTENLYLDTYIHSVLAAELSLQKLEYVSFSGNGTNRGLPEGLTQAQGCQTDALRYDWRCFQP